MKTGEDEPYYLKPLNSRQKEAVLTTEGPLLILAGAGAGKTKTMTHRILHLIKEGARPNSILAITFTNKAAKEMRERVKKLLEDDLLLNQPVQIDEMPFVSTFHSLGVRIIKDNSALLGLPRHFSIFDRGDSKTAVKNALETIGVDPKQVDPSKVLGFISKQKGDGYDVEDYAGKEPKGYFEGIAVKAWVEYEKALQKEKALDFDDLLLKTLKLLRREDVMEHYSNLWKYIHIDEYQDTNRVQYDTAKLLAAKSKNIAVVGDIDQSIYSWRGADFKNIMRFEKDFPGTKEILLEENYRSTKTILAVANAVIKKNVMRKDKNLFTQNDEGDQISLYLAIDEKDEASYVSRTSKMLIDQGVNPSEIAVLYRANFQSRAIEETFVRKNISYELIGTKFFERKEVKDTLSYIKAAMNPDSLSDLKRIINTPARGIGKVTMLKIFEGKEDELSGAVRQKVEEWRRLLNIIKTKAMNEKPSDVVKFVIKNTGLETMLMADRIDGAERLENVRELATIASGYDADEPEIAMEKFLEHVSLASDQDEVEKKGGVKLMTIHASKGLEFDYVFITGLEQDLFPHQRMGGEELTDESKEEERRLFYVALTRARKKLHLSYAETRMIFGSRQINVPSEFIADIDEEFLQYENSSHEKAYGSPGFSFFPDF
ncbi:MAG: UvrD-helicase domain-containing protein [Candidatus Paceibacterota bacterium]